MKEGEKGVLAFKRELKELLSGSKFVEAPNQLALWMMEDFLKLSPNDILCSPQKMLSSEEQRLVLEVAEEILKGRPYQHLLGAVPFLDLSIQVSPAVLIPRPETEYLVHHIIQRHQCQKGLAVLDLCCGSGCCVLALAHHLKLRKAVGLDFSTKALKVAENNAQQLGLDADFWQMNLLELSPEEGKQITAANWDIWVCNPPYVRPSEQQEMSTKVLAHEPSAALFVPEADPMLFYRQVLALAQAAQVPHLYFELNEALYEDYLRLLQSFGICDYHFSKDLNEKWRYLYCNPQARDAV